MVVTCICMVYRPTYYSTRPSMGCAALKLPSKRSIMVCSSLLLMIIAY